MSSVNTGLTMNVSLTRKDCVINVYKSMTYVVIIRSMTLVVKHQSGKYADG